MNNYFKFFLKHAITSGIIIGIIMMIIELGSTRFGGLLSGILPLGFIYIIFWMLLSNLSKSEKINKITIFSKYASIGAIFFFLIIISFYCTIRKTENLIFAFLALLLVSIISVYIIIKYID